jgi:hypothetical protein
VSVLALLLALGGFQTEGIADTFALDRLDMTPGRVTATKAAFFDGKDDKPGCPAIGRRCQRKAWLVRGDMVLLGESRGAFVSVSYSDGAKRMTEGWMLRSAVVPYRAPPASLAAWRGGWVRDDEANITIGAGKRAGTLALSGDALWGLRNSARARGGVNDGSFTGTAVPRGDRVVVDDAECRVVMRLAGGYLVVADNDRCGGLNVSFSGVYRRNR